VWRKASYSGNDGADCVEVTATHDSAIAPHKSSADVLYLMRDSKDPDGPKLAFTASEWDAFVAGVKDGEFDLVSLASAGRQVWASRPVRIGLARAA